MSSGIQASVWPSSDCCGHWGNDLAGRKHLLTLCFSNKTKNKFFFFLSHKFLKCKQMKNLHRSENDTQSQGSSRGYRSYKNGLSIKELCRSSRSINVNIFSLNICQKLINLSTKVWATKSNHHLF